MTAPIIARLRALDAALARHRFPRTSAWWMATLERFYDSGRRQCVLRCGRRGGKSSTLSRVGVAEALYGQHSIPPGDVGVVAIISVSRDEAGQRLRLIKKILDALGVAYKPVEGGIELSDRPIAFKVYAASVAGVSGFTAICVIADEVAKWRDADTGANPATEVLSSLRPTMATQPGARIFLSSSPLGRQDAHARAFEQGDGPFQIVASAATWIANPSVTEEETRALEPDEDVWKREYAAIPLDGSESSLLSPQLVERNTRKGGSLVIEPVSGASYVAFQDPATRGNGWTLAIATERTREDGRDVVQIVLTREWRPRKGAALDPSATFSELAGVLRTYSVRDLWTDQYSFDSLKSIAADHGIELQQEVSTAASKVTTYEGLKRRMADGLVELPDDERVRADLVNVRQWVTRNGLSIELPKMPDGRHCDHAPAIAGVVAKVATSTPGWQRMVDAVEARGGRTPSIALQEHRELHGLRPLQHQFNRTPSSGELEYIDGDCVGVARWKPGDGAPQFSADSDSIFRARALAFFTAHRRG